MTEQNQTPDFASQEAGEAWAQAKADYGDELNIDDVKGTGKDGAITKANVVEYVESLTGGDDQDADDQGEADTEAAQGADVSGDDQDQDASDNGAGDAENDEQSQDDQEADADDEIEPIEGKTLVNLLPNKFEIEGVKIAPKGKTPLTDDLATSKRVAHAIKIGVLGVE